MSRKHFKLVAEAIAGIRDLEERKRMAQLMAGVCRQCNERFMDACGVAS